MNDDQQTKKRDTFWETNDMAQNWTFSKCHVILESVKLFLETHYYQDDHVHESLKAKNTYLHFVNDTPSIFNSFYLDIFVFSRQQKLIQD